MKTKPFKIKFSKRSVFEAPQYVEKLKNILINKTVYVAWFPQKKYFK